MSIPRLNIPDKWKSYYSEYPNGYSLLEAIIEWTDKVNIMIDDLNLTNKQIEKLFTETLPENVENVLNDWYADGKLGDLVNIDLLDKKADKTEITILEDNLSDLESSITDKINESYINVKDFGAKGDGVTDDTNALRNAFSSGEGSTYFVPDGTYRVRAESRTNGINIPSNVRIIFSDRAYLKAITYNNANYRIININDVENVTIENMKLTGDVGVNTSTTGEHGYGVHIEYGRNIKILGGYSNNCFGDGLFVGRLSSNPDYSTNGLLVKDFTCSGNRRQGLTIISGKNLTFENCSFSNTSGTSPSFGVDIEPNDKTAIFENIYFNKCRTYNNSSRKGFGLFNINQNKPVSIVFNDCLSIGDTLLFKNCGGPGYIKFTGEITNPIDSGVTYDNVTLSTEVDVTIKDPNYTNKNANYGMYGHALVFVNGCENAFVKTNIVVSPDNKASGVMIVDSTGGPVKKCIVNFETNLPSSKFFDRFGRPDDIRINEGKPLPTFTTGGNINNEFYTVNALENHEVNNKGKSYSLEHSIGSRSRVNHNKFALRILEPQKMGVRILDGYKIYPGALSGLDSSEVGAYLLLEYYDGKYYIKEKVGTWV